MKRLTESEIRSITSKGLQAFWNAIASEFPQSTGGELSITQTVAQSQACDSAVREWLENNVHCKPDRSQMWKRMVRLTPEDLSAAAKTDPVLVPAADENQNEKRGWIWVDLETGWWFHESPEGCFMCVVENMNPMFPTVGQAIQFTRDNYFE